ncbi:FAD-dependent monooxygenase [Paramicrobacterium chengjingii]|uniref:FAD-dependent monooxygenase n=1 Tax=Paramicrobacterium chengjingii TaxID=2769067 RepID=UPI00141EBA6D|nr:FAD-dependent monooxygenase [Microbacterium chengjingii]
MKYDADVLIIGGGPVGLMTASELSTHGATSIIVEKRSPGDPSEVKCNHVASRTMEAFRRFGIADTVRGAGMPYQHPQDVAFRTSVLGREFGRIPIPSTASRSQGDGIGPDANWATPEPPHRINQIYLNPILERHAESMAGVELRRSTECVGVAQDDDGINATLVDAGDGEVSQVRARYLVGADGGRSLVRKTIGATFHGDPVLQHVQSTYIDAPGLYQAMSARPAWGYYVFGNERQGHVYSVDGKRKFLIHTYLSLDEVEAESVDRDAAIRTILGGGKNIDYSIISTQDWTARRLVADKFREGRMFIAGDSAHVWVPMGGYGMNAGIADGLNLGWLIGAVVDGWADASILDAYVAERQPITDQVSQFAMTHLEKITAADVPGTLDVDGARGDAAREGFGRLAYDLNVQQFAASGLNFGYSYGESPIIVDDGNAPSYTMGTYVPSTVPGCRLPHVWLPDGASLYDRLGEWYTLISCRGDDGEEAQAWVDELQRQTSLPMDVLSLSGVALPDSYTSEYVIVRQDQHVAWRGPRLPSDVNAFAARLGACTCDTAPEPCKGAEIPAEILSSSR